MLSARPFAQRKDSGESARCAACVNSALLRCHVESAEGAIVQGALNFFYAGVCMCVGVGRCVGRCN